MEARRMGAFIKALRKEKNLTQEQLGEALFVSSKTVSRWETGNSLPDLMMLQNIADFFHVDIRELIDGERFPESSPAEIETVRKMAEYSRSKEKKMSRKLWLTFALILLAVGTAAAALILKNRRDELDRKQECWFTGDVIGYFPAGEDRTEIRLLCDSIRIVRLLIGPQTQIEERIQPRIGAQETGLGLKVFCVYTAREENAAKKKGEEYVYPAVSAALMTVEDALSLASPGTLFTASTFDPQETSGQYSSGPGAPSAAYSCHLDGDSRLVTADMKYGGNKTVSVSVAAKKLITGSSRLYYSSESFTDTGTARVQISTPGSTIIIVSATAEYRIMGNKVAELTVM